MSNFLVLEDLKAGDEVGIAGHYQAPKIRKVVRTTKRVIHVEGGQRFSRIHGHDLETYRGGRALYSDCLMSPDVARRKIAEDVRRKEFKAYKDRVHEVLNRIEGMAETKEDVKRLLELALKVS